MLRIANLVRSRVLPRKIPTRAGLPNWDRPDPPPTVKVPVTEEITDEQMIFNFFDASMPEFFITQPQVYEGDTLKQATPMLLKGLGVLFGLAGFFSLNNYLLNPTKTKDEVQPQAKFDLELGKKLREEKTFLNLANQNKIGLVATTENYLFRRNITDNPYGANDASQHLTDRINYIGKVNGEVRNYLINLKEKAAEKVKKQQQAHHHGHSHKEGQVHKEGQAHKEGEAPKEGQSNHH